MKERKSIIGKYSKEWVAYWGYRKNVYLLKSEVDNKFKNCDSMKSQLGKKIYELRKNKESLLNKTNELVRHINDSNLNILTRIDMIRNENKKYLLEKRSMINRSTNQYQKLISIFFDRIDDLSQKLKSI